ncbi:MAG: hypothetical protein A2Z34_10805 [Planctomycetes bacterium RBG_16_59_8]|nr:MAG: hypothetical protein A2Z34_10805 [Planctomycetes bacterium RBG_16_59_8]
MDSGSVTFSALTADFAKRAGLTTNKEGKATLPLSIGSFQTKPIEFTVTNAMEKIGEGSQKSDMEFTDGILGCTLFDQCKITIDYPAGKIAFSPFSDEGAKAVKGESAVVPFEYLKYKDSEKSIVGVFVPAQIETKDGKKQEVVYCIDTACNSMQVDSETAKAIGLPKVNFFQDTASGKRYDIVQAASLSLPGLRWRNVNMVVYDHGQLKLAKEQTGKHVVGLIGTWILQRYIVTFDYHNKEVTFVVPPKK